MANQLATTQARDIRAYLQSDNVRSQVELALPRWLEPDRFLRICVTACNRNPDLAKCESTSLLLAVMQGAQMGLEPDGRLGHLIPRWNGKRNCYEAMFQADYKGLVALVRKNENVADVYADVVRENDVFEIESGLDRSLRHRIDIRKERGAIIGSYSVIKYRDGSSPSFEFMSIADIHRIRDRSDGWRAYQAKKIGSTPWASDEGEMCKKTVLKRLLKLADLSPEIAERVASDPESFVSDGASPEREIRRAHVEVEKPNERLLDSPKTEPEKESTSEDAPPPQRRQRRSRESEPTSEDAVETPVEIAAPEEGGKRSSLREVAKLNEPANETAARPTPDTIAGQILARTEAAGFSEAQVIQTLAMFGVCDHGVKRLELVGEKGLKLALEDIETLLEDLGQRHGGGN